MDSILLTIHQKENRQLLKSWLHALQYIVIEGEFPDALDLDFDLCIIDAAMLKRCQAHIRAYKENQSTLFLPILLVTQNKNVSEATAREIDAEIKAIIDAAYAKSKHILTEHLEELHRLARGLLEYETLSGDEIRTVLRGEPVIRKVVDEPSPEGRRSSVPTAGRPSAPPATGGLGPAPQPG